MFPVIISHVCRTWRQVAFSTPTLWRRVTLSPQMDMWRERIRRAGVCTLDIQLFPCVTPRSGPPQRQFLDIHAVQWQMHVVTPFLRRWRSLEIVFTDYSPFLWNAALSVCCSKSSRAQALALEELSLIYHANDDTKEFCLFSGFAPRLRRVTLDGIRLTWLPSLFSNLTHLDYTHHTFTIEHQAVHDVISMLEVSTRLVELKILFPRKHTPVVPTRPHPISRRVLLPFLSHLHLRVEGSDVPFELAHLMALVLTPYLSSLQLIDVDRRHHPLSQLKALLLRVRNSTFPSIFTYRTWVV